MTVAFALSPLIVVGVSALDALIREPSGSAISTSGISVSDGSARYFAPHSIN